MQDSPTLISSLQDPAQSRLLTKFIRQEVLQWSQEELATALDTRPSTISSWEGPGNSKPPGAIRTLYALLLQDPEGMKERLKQAKEVQTPELGPDWKSETSFKRRIRRPNVDMTFLDRLQSENRSDRERD